MKKNDLQNQIEELGGGHGMPAAEVAKTLVVAGLQGFDSLHMATECLTLRLKELQGPMHTGTCMKPPNFQGLMFVKFRSRYERDLAGGILGTARFKHADKKMCGPRRTCQSQSEQGNYSLWVSGGSCVAGIWHARVLD